MRAVPVRENGHRFPVAASDLRKSDGYLSICAWCGKVRLGNEWVAQEEALAKLQSIAPPRMLRLSHGACNSCKVEVMKELDELRAKHRYNDSL
jgi:hypothetical protein